jgi:hypothetical protein
VKLFHKDTDNPHLETHEDFRLSIRRLLAKILTQVCASTQSTLLCAPSLLLSSVLSADRSR